MANPLEAIIAWLDRPWKAVALVVIGVVGGIGYVSWGERDLIRLYITRTLGTPTVAMDKVDPVLVELAEEADIVSVWFVDVDDNFQEAIAARGDDGDEPLDGYNTAFFEGGEWDDRSVGTISVGALCFDLDTQEPYFNQRPMAFACVQKIPVGTGLIGLVQMAWEETPPRDQQSRAKVLLRQAAIQITEW